jgi:hypothetical protein
MSIKRYSASKDNTITNAFKLNMIDRATDANMGASDILEVFSIYGQTTTSSLEASRILIQFPIDDIVADRNSKKIGVSGNVDFILKLSNAPHTYSTPSDYTLVVSPLSKSWDEGTGLDMESYLDLGFSNWNSASSNQAWISGGGDFLNLDYKQYFDSGIEDLEINITDLVENWINSTIDNNGLIIRLTGSQENSSTSYYTKKFFARGSEFFYKRPWIEARTNDSVRDGRANFVASSSLLSAEDNLNTLFLYNRFRGVLKNIPAIGSGSDIYVSLYAGLDEPTPPALVLQNGSTKIQGGFYKTGIYTASVAINTTSSYLYDVWFSGSTAESSSSIIFATGSIEVQEHIAGYDNKNIQYVVNITNLKKTYSTNELATFRFFARDKDWSPNLYTVSSKEVDNIVIERMFYKIIRIQDNLEVIPFGTGSKQHTKLSCDSEGNYFDLDMSIFEPGYSYLIKTGYFIEDNFIELKESFKFRVE